MMLPDRAHLRLTTHLLHVKGTALWHFPMQTSRFLNAELHSWGVLLPSRPLHPGPCHSLSSFRSCTQALLEKSNGHLSACALAFFSLQDVHNFKRLIT